MQIVSEAVARQVATMADAIGVVEQAFIDFERGQAQAFPVVLGHGCSPTTRFSVKSGVILTQALVGVKVGSYWPQNRARGLPNHGSTTWFLDDDTGLPRALVAASYLNGLRTAAADGVAVKRLARPDAQVLGVLGAGNQAWYEVQAICEVRPIRRVNVWSPDGPEAEDFVRRLRDELHIEAAAPGQEATVREADVLVTITPSRQALFPAGWVRPGTHVSAMGADASGKQELDVALVAAARRYADDIAQSLSMGEFEAAAKAGLIDAGGVRTLGAVLLDPALGRSDPRQITVFDSSGIAMQDLAIAAFALERAQQAGLVTEVDF